MEKDFCGICSRLELSEREEGDVVIMQSVMGLPAWHALLSVP